jgi:hypothetical protein
MLSREAIINLRPPTATGQPRPQSYQSPFLSWLRFRWHITHSTNPSHRSQRNVRILLTLAPDNKGFHSEQTHQDLTSLAILATCNTELAIDLLDGKASCFKQESSETNRRREVLAWGKEGQLESWMKEGENGWILDDSGEARGDWRNSYVVVYVEGDGEEEPAVEVWDRFGSWKPLTEETIEKIRAALREVNNESLRRFAEKLGPIKTDDGRMDDDEARAYQ